ncbi:MAG: PAS domain S-box protein [Burkholderiales bacterium]|nr:PAS domain S-box protein [Burkholderiales bacterium]
MEHPDPAPAAAAPPDTLPPAADAAPVAPAGPASHADPQLFEQIFQSASDALLVVDDQGLIRLANRQSEILFGHRVDELVGRPIEHLIPPRFRDDHRRHRSVYAARPESRPMGMNLALWAQRADGHEFPVEIGLSPFRHGATAMVCAAIRDVSDLRRTQDLLARARQSNAVADFGRLALASKDLDLIQQEACRLVGRHLGVGCALVARREHAGAPFQIGASLGFDDDMRTAIVSRLDGYCATPAGSTDQPVVLGESERDDAGGESAEPPLQGAMLCAIPGEDFCPGALVAGARHTRSFTRDDANFLQALANILGAALQRERTEQQLFQAQRLEALGQLTGGVAHDFNNLLTVVSGNLQILEERVAVDALSARLVKAALRATGRGADLTRKLLAFSRRQTLQPRAIEVRQLLVWLADILRRTLGAHIDVQARVGDGLPSIKADPGMLDTALLNLAVNARDAMPDGGLLTLEARAEVLDAGFAAREDGPAPGRYVMIAVTDTGTGMPPDVRARAFEPFFTTKESGKGSGLGLSLVYGFVKQSGGHIQVQSEPGVGTSIRLYLPTDEQAGAHRVAGHADAGYRGGNETILVVEDDEGVREVAVAFLRRLGYRVLQAPDAPHALALLERERDIDLLFSDIVLRGDVNGPALAREALALRPGLRVVFASGYAPDALPLREALDRRVELLSKPYRIDQLARMLRRALDEAPLAEPREPPPADS